MLHAPPGAGKTTAVPLALLDAAWAQGGRIVMLEPRRVAARAAAERMAETLGEGVGATVGYRIRDEAKVGRATRIEVVTEGVLTRRLQSDPGLDGVACVIFDEFHERSIHADLGLALCLEAQGALRPDLRLLVMSATLDGTAVAALLEGATGAETPLVSAPGRSFPVETRWLDAPLKPERAGGPRFETAAADLAARALAETPEGDALLFLPGVGEIERTAGQLGSQLGAEVDLRRIHGALALSEQRAALAPAPPGRRKIVLATAIAETSLTVAGVRIVIDAGRARRARFDPGAGMGRLVTTRVSRAAAEQRRGRAGRTAPGTCYRLWAKGEEGALAAFDPPEIAEADLAPLALDLAVWGAKPDDLAFLDPPPAPALEAARALLERLGALDSAGRATEHGRRLAALPLHPRLAHLCLTAAGDARAPRLAALLDAGDPMRGGDADLARRLDALTGRNPPPPLRDVAERARRLAQRLPKAPTTNEALSLGGLVALAYPDRVARRRPGGPARFHLSGGTGATLPEEDRLAGDPFLAIAELTGAAETRPGAAAGREARIRLAAPLDRSEIERLFRARIVEEAVCVWDARQDRVTARRRRRLDAVMLDETPWPDPSEEAVAAALLDGMRTVGLTALSWTPAAARLRARIAKTAAADPSLGLPDVSDAGLLADLGAWLGPTLAALAAKGGRTRADLASVDVTTALRARLDWPQSTALDRAAPDRFTAPSGLDAPVDYSDGPPRVAIRLQALYGLQDHPRLAGEPVLFTLLSPAGRPIQTTSDLPGFWAGSYADVAKDMRARYPKHDWPTDPAAATPGQGPRSGARRRR